MVQGAAGAGKTILGSQIIYGHAAEGGRALFVTVLGESHGRMMAHLRPMRFFDQSLIPDRVTYISAYQALDEDEDGLKGLTTLLAPGSPGTRSDAAGARRLSADRGKGRRQLRDEAVHP